jgi:formylmethanofuran dehydrogenase subunit E-like metal-binding protein
MILIDRRKTSRLVIFALLMHFNLNALCQKTYRIKNTFSIQDFNVMVWEVEIKGSKENVRILFELQDFNSEEINYLLSMKKNDRILTTLDTLKNNRFSKFCEFPEACTGFAIDGVVLYDSQVPMFYVSCFNKRENRKNCITKK